MSGFISFNKQLEPLLKHIIACPELHGKWLNTLSYLENCGARKIAACEHPHLVKEEMLKHASEEFRHAFYLKKQLSRIGQTLEDYSLNNLVGGWTSYHYLNGLDLQVSRYLASICSHQALIKQYAYLLVTYAIELRARELYPLYQAILKEHAIRIHVQSIVLEEEEHLAEMERELAKEPVAKGCVEQVCAIESLLFENMLKACMQQLSL